MSIQEIETEDRRAAEGCEQEIEGRRAAEGCEHYQRCSQDRERGGKTLASLLVWPFHLSLMSKCQRKGQACNTADSRMTIINRCKNKLTKGQHN